MRWNGEKEGGREGKGGGGEEEGKISPMCESIGHRPLRGRCPKMIFGIRKKAMDYTFFSIYKRQLFLTQPGRFQIFGHSKPDIL